MQKSGKMEYKKKLSEHDNAPGKKRQKFFDNLRRTISAENPERIDSDDECNT